MRIISVQTGEILLSTNVTKTVASHSKGGDVFKFLDMGTKALELETNLLITLYGLLLSLQFYNWYMTVKNKVSGSLKFQMWNYTHTIKK